MNEGFELIGGEALSRNERPVVLILALSDPVSYTHLTLPTSDLV